MRSVRAAGMTATALILTVALGACGSDSDSGSGSDAGADSGSDAGSGSESTSDDSSGASDPLAERANATMRATSFAASGTSTALDGAEQKVRWDPEQGFEAVVTAGGKEYRIYCKDGTTYTSATMIAETLKGKGEEITVPPQLQDSYVTTDAQEQGCEAYFAIAPAAEAAPGTTEVAGRKAQKLTVSAGGTEDTYYVGASGEPHLLKLESKRDGRTSTTTYEGFGDAYDITVPDASKTVTMEEFRAQTG